MCRCYLYCVADSNNIIEIKGKGINGSEIKVYNMGSYSALYSYIDTDTPERSLNNLRIHNSISLLMMDKYTVLPLMFGTVTKNLDNMGQMLHKYNQRGVFDSLFNCLEGKVEVGIKVFSGIKHEFSSGETFRPAVNRLNAIKDSHEPVQYLLKMVNSSYETRDRAESLEKLSAVFFTGLLPLICDKHIVFGEKGELLINASFLINKENLQDFKNLFFNIKKQFTQYSFIFSGPWPPYSFVEKRREIEKGG
jgi:hypothetical protein